MECYYCGKKGHKKSDCLPRKADLEKAKAEGRPAVHAVTHEVGYPSSSVGDEVRSSGGSAGISVIRTAPGEVAYIWCSARHPCGTSTTRRAPVQR